MYVIIVGCLNQLKLELRGPGASLCRHRKISAAFHHTQNHPHHWRKGQNFELQIGVATESTFLNIPSGKLTVRY